ncbi:DoxX family protein [Runella rosea]|uniref:DoxX family protein n=1 Tax=Runella rosea TaxID=2259595 RepID=A0A344THV4_9BACT|nr:DoxX family protein [Runella rosea]AXE18225.1 DoxX family protein [Runella rosea]
MKTKTILSWLVQIVAAVILLQTLFFKFTGAEESVYIFSKLGVEPYGRIGSGVIELIAGILLLTPRYCWIGAILGLGTMAGAILSHLTVLGIDVLGDGGQLFALALITFKCCALVVILHWSKVISTIRGLLPAH